AATREAREKVVRTIIEIGRPFGASNFGIALALAVTALVGSTLYREVHHAAAIRDGVSTVARVKRLEEGSCVFTGEKNHCVQLVLEVHPDGAPPCEAKLPHVLPLAWMSRVQPGSWLTVAVDREDSSHIELVEEALRGPPPNPAAEQPEPLTRLGA